MFSMNYGFDRIDKCIKFPAKPMDSPGAGFAFIVSILFPAGYFFFFGQVDPVKSLKKE